MRITGWQKNCVLVNIPWWILNLKEQNTKYPITQWKLSTKQSWTRNLIIFSTICNVQQKWFDFQNYRIFARTRKQFPAGWIQTCVHPWRLGKVENFLNKTGVIDPCSRERMNTKWRFYKLTNLTVFAALLEDVPMGCKNAVLPKPVLKNHTVSFLTFDENTRKP